MSQLNISDQDIKNVQEEDKKRRKLLLLLLLLLALLCCVGFFILRYLIHPRPIPEMIPVGEINYPPHYLFSIYGVEKPVGVTVSPDGELIYVSETSGERLNRIFNRDGIEVGSFSPPGTTSAQRSPVYIAADSSGRVFVSDRLQGAIYIYEAKGKYLDSILGPNITLSKYLNQHMGGALPEGTNFYYNIFDGLVTITQPGETEAQGLPAPDLSEWNPLGVRFDRAGNLLVTIVTNHTVHIYPAGSLVAPPWKDFNPKTISFGGYGQEAGQLLFPNAAVVDSRGRIYVTDGNNGRVSVWDPNGVYLFDFAKGTGEGSLSLPRGSFIDGKDRLFIVDAVGQNVKVYDVSGDLPEFLYAFGDYGIDNGLFNYPNDIFVDSTGRLYIADRENNRVQVWSY